MQDLDAIVKDALAVFAQTSDADALEQIKARYLGKAGTINDLAKGLGKLSSAERPAMGARINAAKDVLEAALKARREHLQNLKLEAKLQEESLDVTLPGRGGGFGGLHPVSRTLERVEQI
ncbi:MAG TPA: phenylalanine--tRNA ligase subunit alpha, partial [Burkholderiales bacterium]|nr:phenylalanine--tRNA ligase subunit alpha [Burkholderiales bacterium]